MARLITHKTNLRYLINFTGSSGFLLCTKKQNFFFTDFRYRSAAQALEKSKTRLPFKFIELDKNFEKNFKKALASSKIIEFESQHLTVAELEHWKKSFPKLKWKAMKNTPEKLRLFKDKNEIKALKASQKINEKVFLEIKKWLKPGHKEQEVAWKIKELGHHFGAEDISFEPIVAFGDHSASPHHQNTTRKLKKKDIVLIDMGMKKDGYCSDMTRTFFMGKATPEQEHIYQIVLLAQLAAIQEIKAGVKAAKADEIARKTMGELAEHFGHSLGHGIGLDVHESPNLSSKSKDTLKNNMFVTVEPGIYLPGKFGIRIEDMGRITPDTYENVTQIDK